MNEQELRSEFFAKTGRVATSESVEYQAFLWGFTAAAASRDAEVVSLTNQRDYEYVRAENAEQERDQLREQVTTLRALCMEGANGFGRLLISTGDNVAVRDWQKRCKDAVAATEPKP